MLFLYIFILAILIFAGVIVTFFCITFVRNPKKGVTPTDIKINKTLVPYRSIVDPGIKFNNDTFHKTVSIKSGDGLTLVGDYYPNEENKGTMILFHGYRSVAKRDYACVLKIYYENGFNILLVDQRSHGRSEGKIITFGIKERYDVLSWVDYINTEFNSPQIFLVGLSMGATTVLLSAGLELPDNICGIIADCGFNSPAEIISSVAKRDYHIKGKIIIPLMNILCKIFGKFSLYEASTEQALKNNKIPVLFIHGRNDGFVPCYMSESAYSSAICEKDIIIVDGADHGMSFLVDTPSVLKKYNEFISKYLKSE